MQIRSPHVRRYMPKEVLKKDLQKPQGEDPNDFRAGIRVDKGHSRIRQSHVHPSPSPSNSSKPRLT